MKLSNLNTFSRGRVEAVRQGEMADGDITGVTCTTCGVVPWWQTDGFFEEAELGVVKPECLVDNMRRRLHVHLADGHRLAVLCFECNLWREGEMSAVSAACLCPAMKQHLNHHGRNKTPRAKVIKQL